MSLSKLDSVWVFFKNFSFLKQTFIINYSFFFNPPQRAFFSLLLERKEGVGRERGGQRERKRERERDWLVASHIYPVVWDGTHSLGMCPDQESNGTATFRFTGRRSSRATPPARAGSQYLEPPSGVETPGITQSCERYQMFSALEEWNPHNALRILKLTITSVSPSVRSWKKNSLPCYSKCGSWTVVSTSLGSLLEMQTLRPHFQTSLKSAF